MNIFDEISKWEKSEGKMIFSSILKVKSPIILDYGCGPGNYSFAAANAFDQECTIYAVDTNQHCLDVINERATEEKIHCIKTIRGNENFRQDFDQDSFDLVFYSDLFHAEEKIYGGLHRFVMIEEAKRTLKQGGMLAVLPFHSSNFRNKEKKKCKYSYNKIIDEVTECGFVYADTKQQGVHFEKAYSPYYQKKGGIGFDDLEVGKILTFKLK